MSNRLHASLVTHQPINRDELELNLAINLVTCSRDDIEAVPEEHRSWLRGWLLAHTTQIHARTAISGHTMVSADVPSALVSAHISMLFNALGEEFEKVLQETLADTIKRITDANGHDRWRAGGR